MPVPEAVPARPAATVVLVRAHPQAGVEVFMVRRHVRSEFVPDAFVFPGGSVAPGDRTSEMTAGCCTPVEHSAVTLGSGFRAAAIRECFEEAGVLLARRDGSELVIAPDALPRFTTYRGQLHSGHLTLADLASREKIVLATADLLHWAHWITPEAFPKRFDTHFFLARMPAFQSASHDELETTAGVWVQPEEALSRFKQSEFPLVFATIHQLRALSGLDSIEAAWERFGSRWPNTIMPRVVQRDGRDVILLPDEE